MLTLSHRPKFKEIPLIAKTHDIIISLLRDSEGLSEIGSAFRSEKRSRWISCPFSTKFGISPQDYSRIFDTLRIANNSLFQRKNVFIHCSAGIDRTGLFAYVLLKTGGFTKEQALEILKKKREIILSRIEKHFKEAEIIENRIGQLLSIVDKI